MLRLLVGLVAVGVLFAAASTAHESDEPFAEFFNSLMRPDAGDGKWPCCSYARDCDSVDYELTKEGYVAVLLDGHRVSIPPEKVLHVPNPTGRGALCMVGDTVFCFDPSDSY